jgi:HlyD family secretion protein
MTKRRRIAVVVLVLAVAIAAGLWLWLRDDDGDREAIVASGTVEATDAQLGFRAGGRIASVGPREGDDVAAGEKLAVLDRQEAEARREQAAAAMAAAEARLAELEGGFRSEEVAAAAAAESGFRERLAAAERDLARARLLFEGGAISREEFDRSETAREVAATQLVQAEQQALLLRRGPSREQIDAARSRVEEARAALAAAGATFADRTIEAPFAGVVTVRHREPGEVVAPGAPVVTLLDRGDRWVRIYLPEDRIGAVRLGGPAEIASDTYPDRRYPGEVFFIASEAEFTPKNVQTLEERVRLVYAVKVRVLDDPDHELKPGLPVDVTIPLDGEAEAAGPPPED